MTTALATYKAILTGNHLQWDVDIREYINPERPLAVYVTILDQRISKTERGKQMAEALEKLAMANMLQSIDDPVQWQREIRKDRPRPFENTLEV